VNEPVSCHHSVERPPYQIGCGAGEEDHVANLGAEVESIMQSLVGSVGQIGEARLLAMVALILADRASTAVAANGASNAAASTAPASKRISR
jgi:cell division protein ZapA